MADISTKMETSHFGTTVTGIKADKVYRLAQCYGGVSSRECNLCSAKALTTIPGCLPSTGGRVYLSGCFMRYENYSFFGEHTGEEDRFICVNKTRRNNAFEQSTSKVVFQTVEAAPKSKEYHAGKQALISGTENKSVYAMADCWRTLDIDSCAYCLQKAATSMLGCLLVSEEYALGCICINALLKIYWRFWLIDHLISPVYGIGGKIIAIVMVVTSAVAFLIASIIAFYAWKRKNKSKRRRQGSDDTQLLMMVNNSSFNFKYSTIEKATCCFDEANKLGQGGFGTVYKGVLPDGREIAAKRLFINQRHRAGDFYHEVNIISSVDHKNLVKLIEFSCLGPESILIYEYLPNKSLNHFIFGELHDFPNSPNTSIFDADRGKELNWAKRIDIIVGIAEGLAYLHENSKTRIIHRDIKAANILLDSRLRAKIADFGLARSFQEDKNHISTGIAGTLGYMAPEYILNGKLTKKVDVYSFGVVLLEVVTGIPNRRIQTSEDTHSLLWIAWRNFRQGTLEELFDPNLMLKNDTSSNMKKELKSVIHIGLLCIQEVPSLIPTMFMALQMLSKNIEPLPSPSNPPCIP
ncbi:unnamed protein product [Lactuca saligna]|uniref:Cysteine-rich receptor-like protein kinase 2 n=1 Tax=Lactuca saligna TaxID=75948 RepID=A0AA35YJF5_LACSI|nr:unnamed protein product [Lactuca saligna]